MGSSGLLVQIRAVRAPTAREKSTRQLAIFCKFYYSDAIWKKADNICYNKK